MTLPKATPLSKIQTIETYLKILNKEPGPKAKLFETNLRYLISTDFDSEDNLRFLEFSKNEDLINRNPKISDKEENPSSQKRLSKVEPQVFAKPQGVLKKGTRKFNEGNDRSSSEEKK